MDYNAYHIPVLADECINFLNVRDGGVYFDGTLGGAGHSELILKASDTARLIATDKDQDAIKHAAQRLKPYGDRVSLVNADFNEVAEVLKATATTALDGVILDLGISSHQVDEAERGFSYTKDARLDMRMNQNQEFSAFELVNDYSEEDLKQIFFAYGEEPNSKRIAAAITKARATKAITTTNELAAIIASAAHFDPRRGHPAKKIFQAIRIEVNDELSRLADTVKLLTSKLNTGGRIVIITFHSLEDRIVKQTLRYLEQKCVCPPKMPICTCNKIQQVKVLTHKPITATEQELKQNKRAASAKLRAAERL